MSELERSKAKAALCRRLTGCVGTFNSICRPCTGYKEIVIYEDEYKIEDNKVFVKKSALFREDLAMAIPSVRSTAVLPGLEISGGTGSEKKEKEKEKAT